MIICTKYIGVLRDTDTAHVPKQTTEKHAIQWNTIRKVCLPFFGPPDRILAIPSYQAWDFVPQPTKLLWTIQVTKTMSHIDNVGGHDRNYKETAVFALAEKWISENPFFASPKRLKHWYSFGKRVLFLLTTLPGHGQNIDRHRKQIFLGGIFVKGGFVAFSIGFV